MILPLCLDMHEMRRLQSPNEFKFGKIFNPLIPACTKVYIFILYWTTLAQAVAFETTSEEVVQYNTGISNFNLKS